MRRALPGVLTAIASLVLVVWLYLGNIVFKNYDELGKTPTQQIGTVTNIVVRSTSRGNPSPANLVTVRIGSRQGLVNTHLSIHVGEKLNVECRTGRSGAFYIDYFSPVIVTQ